MQIFRQKYVGICHFLNHIFHRPLPVSTAFLAKEKAYSEADRLLQKRKKQRENYAAWEL